MCTCDDRKRKTVFRILNGLCFDRSEQIQLTNAVRIKGASEAVGRFVWFDNQHSETAQVLGDEKIGCKQKLRSYLLIVMAFYKKLMFGMACATAVGTLAGRCETFREKLDAYFAEHHEEIQKSIQAWDDYNKHEPEYRITEQ